MHLLLHLRLYYFPFAFCNVTHVPDAAINWYTSVVPGQEKDAENITLSKIVTTVQ